MFAGQEEENKKMNDVWCMNLDNKAWSRCEVSEEDFCPSLRSGHTAVVHGQKMFIFGGIFELTHELNDLCCYDFDTKKFCRIGEEAQDQFDESANMESPDANRKTEQTPGLRRGKTFAPTGTMSRSPNKRGSPTRLNMSMKKDMGETDGGHKEAELSSPTSVSMKNTFIIKNADESFEINSKLIPKLKG